MREIMSLSGAKVVVSPRGEFAEGTTNRVVTITGSPSCAQTAHVFVTQKLQQVFVLYLLSVSLQFTIVIAILRACVCLCAVVSSEPQPSSHIA